MREMALTLVFGASPFIEQRLLQRQDGHILGNACVGDAVRCRTMRSSSSWALSSR